MELDRGCTLGTGDERQSQIQQVARAHARLSSAPGEVRASRINGFGGEIYDFAFIIQRRGVCCETTSGQETPAVAGQRRAIHCRTPRGDSPVLCSHDEAA